MKKPNPLFFAVAKEFIRPVLYLFFRFRFELKSSKGIRRPCLILSNHQTGFDHFLVAMGFWFGINYVATDTIFRHGFLSKLMVALVQPIPYSKGSSDLLALKNMLSVIKDGGCVTMFPSGNRSVYGEESPILPGTGKLAKKFNVPLVLMQIRGGYNTLPRWKAKRNVGKMRAAVVRVLQPEEMAAMSWEEVDEIIQESLSFNEFEYNRKAQIPYRGKHKAEYLESILFYCPECSSMTGLCSQGNELFCKDCSARVRVNDTGFFEGVHNAQALPDTILEWSRIQLDYIKNFDFSSFTDKPIFVDNDLGFFLAERARKEEPIGRGPLALYADRLVVCGEEFSLADTTLAIVGVRKLTIYSGNKIFAVLTPWGINLYKYLICFSHLKNKALGLEDGYYGY